MKKSTSDMLIRVEYAMEARIHELDWMSPETKQQALVKLHGVRNKIGYPDKWRDYSSVKITAAMISPATCATPSILNRIAN